MHKQLHCTCKIKLRIKLLGPLLIKSSVPSAPSGPDMQPVLMNGAPVLPGSSLKGVIRSHAEKIARTLWYVEDRSRSGCCDPFNSPRDGAPRDATTACSTILNSNLTGPQTYGLCCPICKVFGALGLAGRFTIGDATPNRDDRPEVNHYRDGVGIDRRTGGPHGGALFKMQVVAKGTFDTEILITNFELWQLGLVAFVLRDMGEGTVFVGGGSSRGLGRVQGIVDAVTLTYPLWSRPEPTDLPGMAQLLPGSDYGFWEGEEGGTPVAPILLPNLGVTAEEDEWGLGGKRVAFDTIQAQKALWVAVAPLAARFIKDYGEHRSHLRVPEPQEAGANGGG